MAGSTTHQWFRNLWEERYILHSHLCVTRVATIILRTIVIKYKYIYSKFQLDIIIFAWSSASRQFRWATWCAWLLLQFPNKFKNLYCIFCFKMIIKFLLFCSLFWSLFIIPEEFRKLITNNPSIRNCSLSNIDQHVILLYNERI